MTSIVIKGRKWRVLVDDNFNFMDESERYLLGEFDSREEAVAVCRKKVDDFVSAQFKPGMTAEKLFQLYSSFGQDPFIVADAPPSKFSAWDYARERCGIICGPPPDYEIPPLKTRPIPGRVPLSDISPNWTECMT